jgi:hypothetical protein
MPALAAALVFAASLAAIRDLRAGAAVAVPLFVVWAIAVALLPRPRGGLRSLVAAAIAVRAILLFTEPTLSDDLFRYLWEGRVVGAGDNPFLYPPSDPHWAFAATDWIHLRVNHADVSTIYPPVALWSFALVSWIHYAPITAQAFAALVDVILVGALYDTLVARHRSTDAAWLYALHPLGAVEAASNGHLESLGLLFSLLAIRAWERGRPGVVWALLGGGTKLLPFAIVPSLLRTRGRRALLELGVGVVALAALTAPFVGAGATLVRGFTTYAQHWSFNASLFAILELIFGAHARLIGSCIAALIAAWAIVRFRDPAHVALWCGGTFVLLSPTVHPWYVLWAWVPALVVGVRSWTVLACLAPLSYWVLVGYDPAGSWHEPWWPRWIVYPPFFLLLFAESAWHAIPPGPWASGRAPTPSP